MDRPGLNPWEIQKTMVKRVFSALAVAFVSIACSGIATKQDFVPGTYFSGLRTYDWMPGLEPSRDPLQGTRTSQSLSTSSCKTKPITIPSTITMAAVVGKELVWRGIAEGKVHEAKTPRERQERADQAVQMIMKQFPPTR
jgi:hypothetical protein